MACPACSKQLADEHGCTATHHDDGITQVTDRSGPFAWTPRTYGLAFWVAAANVVLLHHLIPHLCGDCTADPQLPDILTVEPGALVEVGGL
jgi:hypothetical protein